MAGAKLLYFDYADHLEPESFPEIPTADWLGVAKLEDHLLGADLAGQPLARPMPGSVLWGALWLLPAEALETLDRSAGVAEGRRIRTTARIVSPAGPRGEAMIYGAADTTPGPIDPARRDRLAAAAKAIRLPSAYVASIRKLA